MVHHVWTLHALGFELYATAETQPFLAEKGIPTTLVHYADSTASPNIRELISNDKIDLVRALIYLYLGLYLFLSSPYLCPTMIDQVRARALP